MNKYISFVGLAALVTLGLFAYEHKKTEDSTIKNVLSYSNEPPKKNESSQQSNPHYAKTLNSLAFAVNLLSHHSTSYEAKKEAMAEIWTAQKLLAQPGGYYAAAETFFPGGRKLNEIIEHLTTARDETLLAEENILSPQIKILVRAHIQAAIDKVVELQNTEQKSQPQKSNP